MNSSALIDCVSPKLRSLLCTTLSVLLGLNLAYPGAPVGELSTSEVAVGVEKFINCAGALFDVLASQVDDFAVDRRCSVVTPPRPVGERRIFGEPS